MLKKQYGQYLINEIDKVKSIKSSLQQNIDITGGADFVGSHVVRLFVNKYCNRSPFNIKELMSIK